MPIFGPIDEEEGTGSDSYAASGVEEYVVELLVRAVPEVKSLGHWTRNVPSNPEQYNDSEQTAFHSSFISQSSVTGQPGVLKRRICTNTWYAISNPGSICRFRTQLW